MPSYTVNYFNARGRGEILRLLLSLGGEKFEDRRVEGESWQKLKPSTPFGQLPTLEVDGKHLAQSNAASRYLAKKFGAYGSNTWEEAQIDMIVDCVDDLIKPYFTMAFNKDEAQKAEQKNKYEGEELPNFMAKLEKLLSSNGNGEYFVGKKISWADIHYAHFITYPENAQIKIDYSKYPKLKALKARVESNPRIKAWIATRPKTNF